MWAITQRCLEKHTSFGLANAMGERTKGKVDGWVANNKIYNTNNTLFDFNQTENV